MHQTARTKQPDKQDNQTVGGEGGAGGGRIMVRGRRWSRGAGPDTETDAQLTAIGKPALFCPKMPNQMSGLCFILCRGSSMNGHKKNP